MLLKVGGDEDSEEEVGMGGPSKLDSEGEDEKSDDEWVINDNDSYDLLFIMSAETEKLFFF